MRHHGNLPKLKVVKTQLALNPNQFFQPGNKHGLGHSLGKFKPGPQYFTEEQWGRKLNGLRKAWAVKAKLRAGKRVMTLKKKQESRNRKMRQVSKEAYEIQNRAREHAWMGIEELARIIQCEKTPSAVKVSAIALLHERAYGKPSSTTINANIDLNGKPQELSPEELDSRITTLMRRIEDSSKRTIKEVESPPQLIDLRKLN